MKIFFMALISIFCSQLCLANDRATAAIDRVSKNVVDNQIKILRMIIAEHDKF